MINIKVFLNIYLVTCWYLDDESKGSHSVESYTDDTSRCAIVLSELIQTWYFIKYWCLFI